MVPDNYKAYGKGALTFWETGRDRIYVVYGGPYKARPKGAFCVKMAKEIKAIFDVNIPTPDFSTPDREVLVQGLYQTLQAMRAGRLVYVGCAFGQGRTGLFLACLARAMGQTHPVEFVRTWYYPKAVETPEQYKFVTDGWQVPWRMRWLVWKMKHLPWGPSTQPLDKQG